MKRLLATCILLLSLAAPGAQAGPRVVLETSLGPVTLELDPEAAPKSVRNFINYVEAGFYDETIFHRVIAGFMVQGGGFTTDLIRKPTREPIGNEAFNGLRNTRGTLAMARTRDPHSATAQFFINLVDNDFLNHTAKTPRGWGYTVFGRVVDGMDVVDTIAAAKTGNVNGMGDVPLDAIVIGSAQVVESAE